MANALKTIREHDIYSDFSCKFLAPPGGKPKLNVKEKTRFTTTGPSDSNNQSQLILIIYIGYNLVVFVNLASNSSFTQKRIIVFRGKAIKLTFSTFK